MERKTYYGPGMYPAVNNSEAPELEFFFSSLTKNSALNYCVVCLRTDKERSLARCKFFKEFSNVTKIQNNWQNHLICFICEHQAASALRFFKKAVFASTVNKILLEYLYQKSCVRKQLFQQKVFKEILDKLGLNNGEYTSPSEYEEELLFVRGTSQLNETKTLVIDNTKGKNNDSNSSSSTRIPNPYGEVTATAVSSAKLRRQSNTAEERLSRPKKPPTRYGWTDETSNSTGSKSEKTGNLNKTGIFKKDNSTKPETSGIKPDLVKSKPVPNDSFELSSPQPKVSEALVILDDDEPNQPYPIRIDKVVSNAIFEPPAPSTAPKLVPIENLLQKPNEIALPNQKPMQDNIFLHPIVLSGGVLTVPSLTANIINGQLVYTSLNQPLPQNLDSQIIFQTDIQNTPSNLNNPIMTISPLIENVHTVPSDNKLLRDLIQKPNSNINKAFPMTDNKFPVKNLNAVVASADKTRELTPKRAANDLKLDGEESKDSVKKGRKDSTANRIDWEDKIPMDVISFVDAVDPNPTIMPANIGLSQVQINRPQTIETGADVIDLG